MLTKTKKICAIAIPRRDASTGFFLEALRLSGADRQRGVVPTNTPPPPLPLAKVAKYGKRARVNMKDVSPTVIAERPAIYVSLSFAADK